MTCSICGSEICRSAAHAEEAGILAAAPATSRLHFCAGESCPGLPYRASDVPHPASCAVSKKGPPCVRCGGSGRVRRGLRDFMCPGCLGEGIAVRVEVTAEGKAVRIPSLGEAVSAGPRRGS